MHPLTPCANLDTSSSAMDVDNVDIFSAVRLKVVNVEPSSPPPLAPSPILLPSRDNATSTEPYTATKIIHEYSYENDREAGVNGGKRVHSRSQSTPIDKYNGAHKPNVIQGKPRSTANDTEDDDGDVTLRPSDAVTVDDNGSPVNHPEINGLGRLAERINTRESVDTIRPTFSRTTMATSNSRPSSMEKPFPQAKEGAQRKPFKIRRKPVPRLEDLPPLQPKRLKSSYLGSPIKLSSDSTAHGCSSNMFASSKPRENITPPPLPASLPESVVHTFVPRIMHAQGRDAGSPMWSKARSALKLHSRSSISLHRSATPPVIATKSPTAPSTPSSGRMWSAMPSILGSSATMDIFTRKESDDPPSLQSPIVFHSSATNADANILPKSLDSYSTIASVAIESDHSSESLFYDKGKPSFSAPNLPYLPYGDSLSETAYSSENSTDGHDMKIAASKYSLAGKIKNLPSIVKLKGSTINDLLSTPAQRLKSLVPATRNNRLSKDAKSFDRCRQARIQLKYVAADDTIPHTPFHPEDFARRSLSAEAGCNSDWSCKNFDAHKTYYDDKYDADGLPEGHQSPLTEEELEMEMEVTREMLELISQEHAKEYLALRSTIQQLRQEVQSLMGVEKSDSELRQSGYEVSLIDDYLSDSGVLEDDDLGSPANSENLESPETPGLIQDDYPILLASYIVKRQKNCRRKRACMGLREASDVGYWYGRLQLGEDTDNSSDV